MEIPSQSRSCWLRFGPGSGVSGSMRKLIFQLSARTYSQFVLGLILVHAFAPAWAQDAPKLESKTPAMKLKELRLYPAEIRLASSRSTQKLIVQGIYDNGYVDDVTSK